MAQGINARPGWVDEAEGSGAIPPRLADLYRRHWSELSAYVRKTFGPGPPEPEDIAQAAFLQLSDRGGLDDLANPRAFLYRVVHNLAVQERRREAVRARITVLNGALSPARDDLDPERVSLAMDQRRRLEMAFAALDPRTRRMLIMSRQEGLSSAEIGRLLRLSPTQVKRLLAQAIVRLRAYVENEPAEGGR